MKGRVLVVDDEEGIRSFIAEILQDEGLTVTLAVDGRQARQLLDQQSFHLMLTDLKMPELDGMTLLRQAKELIPEMEVIVLTAYGTVDSAVEAMRLGAFDYLRKPLSGPEELCLIVDRALERRRLREQGQQGRGDENGVMVATDPAMRPIVEQLSRVALTNTTVLLQGQSGTGKEVAARMIHRQSKRNSAPFIAVNCAAVSAELVESEMFGHERGAFTGATDRRRGRFELADGGTLFLDEISEIPLPLQAKLLRVLQERSFERVGGSRTIEVDVRLIAATNRDLEQEIARGTFREDLYHRLAVFPIGLPRLCDRPGDIIPLAQHLLTKISHQLGRPNLTIGEAAQERLLSYPWPGNVRELSNALERAAILSNGDAIEADGLILNRPPNANSAPVLDGTLKAIEREAIKRALATVNGHRKKAAAQLGIGLRTLYDKIKEYDLK